MNRARHVAKLPPAARLVGTVGAIFALWGAFAWGCTYDFEVPAGDPQPADASIEDGSTEGSGGTNGTGGTGGAGGAEFRCGPDKGAVCNSCLEDSCQAECEACNGVSDCVSWIECVDSCLNVACEETCSEESPAGQYLGLAVKSCRATNCGIACGGAGGNAGAGGAAGAAGAAGASGAGGSGGATTTCGLTLGSSSCEDCIDSSCGAICETCVSEAQCLPSLSCWQYCPDQACRDACEAQFPDGVAPSQDLMSCFMGSCLSSCVTADVGCDLPTGMTACDACQAANCAPECAGCSRFLNCGRWALCASACGANPSCIADCDTVYPNGQGSYTLYLGCLQTNCSTECNIPAP